MERNARRAVVGAGTWGTTLALHLAKRGPVVLLARDEEQARALTDERRNARYLPDITIPVEIEITADPQQLDAADELVIFAVPAAAMRSTAARVAPAIRDNAVLLSVAKGIEHGIAAAHDPGPRDGDPGGQGPHRRHVRTQPGPRDRTRTAGQQRHRGRGRVGQPAAPSEMIGARSFRLYRNRDVIGVELCGALKNIIAIAAGAAEQLGFGDNGKAGLITRGLAEITRLGIAAGANPLTFAGLAGLGDVMATCYSNLSRNHTLGVELAKGRQVARYRGHAAGRGGGRLHGHVGARSWPAKLGVEMPIAQEVYNALFEGKSVQRCLIDLLSREQKDELAGFGEWSAKRRRRPLK